MVDTVTGFTAARMKLIEDSAIIDGEIVGDNLILTRYDESTIDAGNVRGPMGPMNPDGNPVGTIISGGWASEPTGYLFLEGGFIALGAIAFEDLAAVYPEWVSGDDLQLPNVVGGVLMCGVGPSIVSGSMTHTLTQANLAAHTHTGPSHTHTGPSHTHTGPLHGHAIPSHVHSASTGAQGDHVHQAETIAGYEQSYTMRLTGYVSGTRMYTIFDGGGGTLHQFADHQWGGNYRHVRPDGGHSHTVSIGGSGTLYANNDGTGATGASGTGATGASGTAATGSTGNGTAVDHTPKNLLVRFAVKY